MAYSREAKRSHPRDTRIEKGERPYEDSRRLSIVHFLASQLHHFYGKMAKSYK